MGVCNWEEGPSDLGETERFWPEGARRYADAPLPVGMSPPLGKCTVGEIPGRAEDNLSVFNIPEVLLMLLAREILALE